MDFPTVLQSTKLVINITIEGLNWDSNFKTRMQSWLNFLVKVLNYLHTFLTDTETKFPSLTFESHIEENLKSH